MELWLKQWWRENVSHIQYCMWHINSNPHLLWTILVWWRDIAYMRGKEIIKVGTDASNILYVLNLLVARDSSADSDYMIWNTDEIRSDIRSDRFSFNSEPLWRMRGCDVAKVRCMNLNLEFFGNSQASYHQVIKYNLLIIFSLTISPFQLWLADTPNSYFFDKKCVFYSTSSCDA